jgi:hypothetical protein
MRINVNYSEEKGLHSGTDFFASGKVSFEANPGDRLRIYESGRIEKLPSL